MPDVSIVNTSVTAAPTDYTVPGTQELLLKAVRASIDGTGAAGSFLPALQLLDPAGHVMWTAVDPSGSVAAGASADVSWFPGVTAAAATGVVAAQVRQGAHVYAVGSNHVVTFSAASFTTNDPATFTMPSGTPMHIAHGGLIMTGLICQFGPNGGIPYSGEFELSTEILDAASVPVDQLTNPNFYTPELYGTDPNDTYNPNGYAFFNCDDSTFTPPYTLLTTVSNQTAITTTELGLVVAILTPTGLT